MVQIKQKLSILLLWILFTFIQSKPLGVCKTYFSILGIDGDGLNGRDLCSQEELPFVYFVLHCTDKDSLKCAKNVQWSALSVCDKINIHHEEIPVTTALNTLITSELSIELSLYIQFDDRVSEVDEFSIHTKVDPDEKNLKTLIQSVGKYHQTKLEVEFHRVCTLPEHLKSPFQVISYLVRNESSKRRRKRQVTPSLEYADPSLADLQPSISSRSRTPYYQPSPDSNGLNNNYVNPISNKMYVPSSTTESVYKHFWSDVARRQSKTLSPEPSLSSPPKSNVSSPVKPSLSFPPKPSLSSPSEPPAQPAAGVRNPYITHMATTTPETITHDRFSLSDLYKLNNVSVLRDVRDPEVLNSSDVTVGPTVRSIINTIAPASTPPVIINRSTTPLTPPTILTTPESPTTKPPTISMSTTTVPQTTTKSQTTKPPVTSPKPTTASTSPTTSPNPITASTTPTTTPSPTTQPPSKLTTPEQTTTTKPKPSTTTATKPERTTEKLKPTTNIVKETPPTTQPSTSTQEKTTRKQKPPTSTTAAIPDPTTRRRTPPTTKPSTTTSRPKETSRQPTTLSNRPNQKTTTNEPEIRKQTTTGVVAANNSTDYPVSTEPSFTSPSPSSSQETDTAASSSSRMESNSGDPPEESDDGSFWPIVAAMVIGIPSVIVFAIAITVIHKKRLGRAPRFLSSSMYPSL